ncbi:hypothetical protein RQP46_009288 [Phenoliferia psychrophenolica]
MPLIGALYTMVWATALAPTTSMSFLSSSSTRPLATHGRLASGIAIGVGVIIIASLIPITVLMSRAHTVEFGAIDELLVALDSAKAANQSLSGLTGLLPLYSEIADVSATFLVYYRAMTGLYFAWMCLFLIVYIPTVIRLLLSLHNRKRRFLRSLRSLRVLDEIVTQDDQAQGGTEMAESHRQRTVTLPSAVPLSPAFPPRSFAASPPGSPNSVPGFSQRDYDAKGDNESISTDSHARPESRTDVTITIKDSSKKGSAKKAHVLDLEANLAKTSSLFTTILVQCVVTLLMAVSIFIFCVILFKSSLQQVNLIFLPWTGWTFGAAGLAISLVFAIFSARGPRIAAPAPPSLPKPKSSPRPDAEGSPNDKNGGNESEFLPSPSQYGSHVQIFGLDGGSGASEAPTAAPSMFARAAGALRSRKASIDFIETSSTQGRSLREWAAQASAPSEFEMGDAASSMRGSLPSFVQPSPVQRWVPSAWAAAERGRSEMHLEEDEAEEVDEAGRRELGSPR